MPLAEGDLAVVTPAGNAHRAAFLLPAQHVIRKTIVGADVVKLGRRLIIPRTEGLSAVDSDDSSLIARQNQRIWFIGVDPEPVVVVATGGTPKIVPGFATVLGFPGGYVGNEHHVGIGGVDFYLGEVAAPAPEPRVAAEPGPGCPGIIGSVDPAHFRRIDGGIEPVRVAGSNAKANAAQALSNGRQAVRQFLPGGAAIGRFVEAAFGSLPGTVFPGALPGRPQVSVNDV